MMAKVMLKGKYQVGKDLRVHLQDMKKPLKLKNNDSKFGLGYKLTHKDYFRVHEEMKKGRIAYL